MKDTKTVLALCEEANNAYLRWLEAENTAREALEDRDFYSYSPSLYFSESGEKPLRSLGSYDIENIRDLLEAQDKLKAETGEFLPGEEVWEIMKQRGMS